jgi:hydroxymethylglutaryl-CoA synthase
MSVGIDDISFYTSNFYFDLKSLADVQGIDPEKYYQGIGQEQMGIVGADEDVVTLAAAAALPLFDRCDKDSIDTLMFATETGVDQSKAAGIFVHGLLGLPSRCRVVELKQACYSATAAIQMACSIVAREPQRKVLVLASDIARYDLNSSGEATQGCGAVAVLVSANPRLVAIEPQSGRYTEDVMDFWRPNYRATALVDGKYSTKIYLKALKQAYADYLEQGGVDYDQMDFICYHLPFSRMAEKAQKQLSRFSASQRDAGQLEAMTAPSLHYNKTIGNSYSASIWIGLASLFDHADQNLAGKRIGFFSYGSGCVGEFFSGTVQPGYRDGLRTQAHQQMLAARTELTYQDYLQFYHFGYPTDGQDHEMPEQTSGPFRLSAINQHKRVYSAR